MRCGHFSVMRNGVSLRRSALGLRRLEFDERAHIPSAAGEQFDGALDERAILGVVEHHTNVKIKPSEPLSRVLFENAPAELRHEAAIGEGNRMETAA